MALEKRSCIDCEHSIYCDTWGEYKCTVKVMRIYEPENEAIRCKDFKRAPRKDALGDKKKPKCQCKHCQSRVDE